MALLKFCDKVLWLAILAMIGAFFLPWVRLDADLLRPLKQAEQAGMGSVFGKLRERIETERKSLEQQTGYKIRTEGAIQASGLEIPRLVNSDDAQLTLAFVQLFTDKTDGIEWKCRGVYVMPGLALLLGLLYQFVRVPRWGPLRKFPFLVCLIAAATFFGALYKVNHARLDHLLVQIQIGLGLWISIFGYALIAVAALFGTLALCFIRPKK